MINKFRRGTTANNLAYTGGPGSLSIDTDKKMVRVHNGVKAGGFPCGGFEPPAADGKHYALRNGIWVSIHSPEYAPPQPPGPTTFIGGDINAGFYGEATVFDLFSASLLASQVGLSAGTLVNDTGNAWLKFAFKGKILYMPKKGMRAGMTWQHLYNAGLVYGTDDFGLYPTTTPTNQLKIVSRGGFSYKVRLIRGAEADPSAESGGGGGTTVSTLFGPSEWNQLFLRVLSPEFSTQGGPNWAAYTAADVDMATAYYAWVMETVKADTTSSYTRGALHSGADSFRRVVKNNNFETRWRPVLEYLPPA